MERVLKMKNKVFGKITTAVMAAAIMAGQAITAFADSDVKLDCANAVESSGWTQSVEFRYNNDDPDDLKGFDATRMTDQSVITVSYDILETYETDGSTGFPVELIFQSWSYPEDTSMVNTATGAVWAKVAPVEVDEENNTESFNYEDIVAAYGTSNFEKVDAILFGSTNDAKIKITAVTITNCKDEGHHWVDPAIAEQAKAQQEKEKEAQEKVKAAEQKNIIGIIIGIVAGVAVAVGVIWFIISSKSREAFDVSTGEFVDKKDAK